ncbi:MAG: 4Fe-4S dicluster domain-containing protein [Actinobacteria bacterium]|nr:4Fe-4S dicluster domain-containing protein [Actinomycetota bacterium]
MCPAKALRRDTTTAAVIVDADRCLGCRTCVEVCPFGAPAVDYRTGKADKCDLCNGDPTCVKFCSQGALSFVSAEDESFQRKRAMVSGYVEYLAGDAAVGI